MRFRLFSATVLLATIGISYAADPDSVGRGLAVEGAGPELGQPAGKAGRRAKRDPVLPVHPHTGQPVHTGRILLKMRDDSAVRAPREFTNALPAEVNAEAQEFSELLAQFGGQVRQLITSRSDAELAAITARAEERSGNPQPDLTAFLVVETPGSLMMLAAQALNQLDSVEYVEIEKQIIQTQNCPSVVNCGNGPPCNRPRSWGQTPYTALAAPGINPSAPAAANSWRPNPPPPPCVEACGQPGPPGNVRCNPFPGSTGFDGSYAGCEDLNCCELIATIPGYELCADGDRDKGWDIYCAALANLLCGGIDADPVHSRKTIYSTPYDPDLPFPNVLLPLDLAYDPCFSDFQIRGDFANVDANPLFETVSASQMLGGSCFVARDSRGCDQPRCCFNVCTIDPLCCDLAWDSGCVTLAEDQPSCIPAAVAAATPSSDIPVKVAVPATQSVTYQALVLNPPAPPTVLWELKGWPAFNPGTGFEPKVPLRNEGPFGSVPIDNCVFTQPLCNPPFPNVVLGQTPRRVAGMQAYTTFEPVIPGVTQLNCPMDCQDGLPNLATTAGSGFQTFESFSQYRGGGIDLYGLQEVMFDFAAYYQGDGTLYRDFAYGGNVRVGVIDLTANLFHEDFQFKMPWPTGTQFDRNPTNFAAEPAGEPFRVDGWEASTFDSKVGFGQVKLEPGIDQTFLAGNPFWAEHGTAVLSILLAAENQFGVTGIASKSEGYFFPALLADPSNPTQLNYRLADALTGSISLFDPGDVVCVPLSFANSQPITTDTVMADLLVVARDSGIIVVVSAGNGGVPVAPSGNDADTGAIIVGAVTPGASLPGNILQPNPSPFQPNCPISESNFTDPEEPGEGGRVQVAAWGAYVVAAGYGDLFRGTNVGTEFDSQSGQSSTGRLNDENDLRSYTKSFGGTSAAAAMVAGIAANVQGFAKQVYEQTPVGPESMLDLLTSPQATSALTCNDIDSNVGHFPNNLREIAYDVIQGEFFGAGAGSANGVEIMNGFAVGQQPAVHQIRLDDGVYLKVGSVTASSGQRVRGVAYPLGGNSTDVLAYLSTPVPADEIDGVADRLQIELNGRVTSGNSLVMAYLYNFESGRWDWHGIDFYRSAEAQVIFDFIEFYGPSFSASQYVEPSSGEMMLRVITFSLGPSAPNQTWHDLIKMGLGDPTKEP